jgi:peptide/nickel transport system substrate-binding protein
VNSSFIDVQNAFYTPAHQEWYKKDLKKAQQLLKEAGYKGEEIEIVTTKKYAMMYNIGVAVQSELAAAGIKTKLKVIEWANVLNLLYSGDYQILTFGVSPRPDPVTSYLYLKYNGFDDQYPRMKQVRDEAQTTLDFEARKKLFEEAHRLVYQGVPAIVFFNYNYFHAYWNYIKGYKMWNTNFPRFWGVWLEK